MLVEDPSDVLDNVKSQGSVRNSAIIAAVQQNASWNSALQNSAGGVRSIRAIRNLERYDMVVGRFRSHGTSKE